MEQVLRKGDSCQQALLLPLHQSVLPSSHANQD